MEQKTVLVIHGWPQAFDNEHFLYFYFAKRGYNIVSPYFFNLDNFNRLIEGSIPIILLKNLDV